MTCVVGVVDSATGDVHMAADSAATFGNGDMVRNLRSPRKIFRSNDLLIGFCGEVRIPQLLQLIADLDPCGPDEELESYLAGPFSVAIQALKEAFAYHPGQEDGRPSSNGASFLIGGRGRLFIVSFLSEHLEMSDGFEAIGSGAPFALAVLHATQSENMPPRDRLKRALETTEYLCPSVRAPFQFETIGAHVECDYTNHRGDRGAPKDAKESRRRRSTPVRRVAEGYHGSQRRQSDRPRRATRRVA